MFLKFLREENIKILAENAWCMRPERNREIIMIQNQLMFLKLSLQVLPFEFLSFLRFVSLKKFSGGGVVGWSV